MSMDSDFFGGSGEVVYQTQQYNQFNFQSQDNATGGDQFDFIEPTSGSNTIIPPPSTSGYSYNQIDNQAIRRMQQEQNRIQDMLRQKSNEEYEAKLRRKQQGRRQYQQYLSKKQAETMARKADNIEKQRKLLENNARLSQEAGWRKVAANVSLKQGEHKGKRQTTRMRQSIINKKNDQIN